MTWPLTMVEGGPLPLLAFFFEADPLAFMAPIEASLRALRCSRRGVSLGFEEGSDARLANREAATGNKGPT